MGLIKIAGLGDDYRYCPIREKSVSVSYQDRFEMNVERSRSVLDDSENIIAIKTYSLGNAQALALLLDIPAAGNYRHRSG
jgi:arginine repressor